MRDENYPLLSAYLRDGFGEILDDSFVGVLTAAEEQSVPMSVNRAREIAAALIWSAVVSELNRLEVDQWENDDAGNLYWLVEAKREKATPQAVLMDLSGSRSLLDDAWLFQHGKLAVKVEGVEK